MSGTLLSACPRVGCSSQPHHICGGRPNEPDRVFGWIGAVQYLVAGRACSFFQSIILFLVSPMRPSPMRPPRPAPAPPARRSSATPARPRPHMYEIQSNQTPLCVPYSKRCFLRNPPLEIQRLDFGRFPLPRQKSEGWPAGLATEITCPNPTPTKNFLRRLRRLSAGHPARNCRISVTCPLHKYLKVKVGDELGRRRGARAHGGKLQRSKHACAHTSAHTR